MKMFKLMPPLCVAAILCSGRVAAADPWCDYSVGAIGALAKLTRGASDPKDIDNRGTGITGHYAYVLGRWGYVYMFSLSDTTGQLKPLVPPKAPDGDAAGDRTAITVDPSGKYAYVTEMACGTVSMFSVASNTGALTPLSPFQVKTGHFPNDFIVDPSGQYGYATNRPDSTISMYSLDTGTGILKPLSPPTVDNGGRPTAMVIVPSGQYAYVANTDSDSISMYSRAADTGILTPLSPATIATGSPSAIAVDPTGQYAYVTNLSDGTISMYSSTKGTGILAPLNPRTVSAGFGPNAVKVDPSGRYVYAVNGGDFSGWSPDSISMYKLDRGTGLLTPLSTPTVATGDHPNAISFDQFGRYAFVTNQIGESVSMFSLDPASGILSPLASPTVNVGEQPVAIVVR